MSYILDAIRKSEQQRQRNTGPSLYAPSISSNTEKPISFLLYGFLAATLIFSAIVLAFLRPWQHDKSNSETIAAATIVHELPHPAVVLPQPSTLEVKPSIKSEQAVAVQKPQSPPTKPHIEYVEKQSQLLTPEQPAKTLKQSVASQPTIASKPLLKELPVPPAKNSNSQPTDKALTEASTITATRSKEPALEQKIMALSELPASIQQEIPKMSIPGYSFSNVARESTVGINDRLLQEGDYLIDGLRLERIGPDGLVFSYKNYLFRQSLQ